MCVSHYVISVSVKNLFPVYMEAFPVQSLTPAGVSCFVQLMSQIARRHPGIYLADLEWIENWAVGWIL